MFWGALGHGSNLLTQPKSELMSENSLVRFLRRLLHPARSTAAVLRTTYEQWRNHRTIRLGAGIAYYGLFATIPIIALGLALASIFVSEAEAQGYLTDQLESIFGTDSAAISDSVYESLSGSSTMAGLGIVGLISLLFAASFLVVALQDALNTIWELPVRSGLRRSIARRLIAFAVVLSSGAYIVAALAVNAVTALIERLVPDAAILDSLTELFGLALSWALGVMVIALLFRYITDVRVPWPSALLGGAVTALLVAIGTVLIGAYLRRYAASSVVGATGGIFLFLIWMYFEAQIFLAGAEFTRVLTGSASANEREPDAG
jgi:membrane protein